VRLLLDTNVLLWWLSDHSALPGRAREIIADPGNDLLVSSASVWEIAIKAGLGRIEIELNHLEEAILKSGFQPLLISFRHALGVSRLPNVHRDPFDRILVAQARAEKLRILSHDRVFERYGLRTEGLDPIIV
jgi:PIN domain nuclease of toxin-antitoxin system